MPSVNETRLASYLAAEASILQAQESRSEGRTFRMADLAEVRAEIEKLQRAVNREKSGAGLNYALADLSGGCS
jgi:hypothetical protein